MGCGCGRRAKRVSRATTRSSPARKRVAKASDTKSSKIANRGSSIRRKRLTKIISSPKKYR